MQNNNTLKKILRVDDASSILAYLKEILKPLNVHITEAKDGLAAFNLIKSEHFDLLLSDINMPKMSGLVLSKKIMLEPKYRHFPIILMTGLESPALIEEAFKNGAIDYITKPLRPAEVLSRITARLKCSKRVKELSAQKLNAEKSSQAKSEFISRLAHELKTPLNAISGFTQLIALDSQDKEILDYCEFIAQASKHQTALINEVTHLMKIEAGIIAIQYSDINLSDILQDSIHLTQPMARQFDVIVNVPDKQETMYTVTADYTRLKQVFLNLLSNAIKYNKPQGQVNILVKPSKDGRIKIGISDTGLGISKENLPKIFEVFNRIGAEGGTVEGTGLGLPITKKIIELMGGSIEVESTQGEGSVFWIDINAQEMIE